MAEEKKGPSKDLFVEIAYLMLGLFFLMTILNRLADYFYYYFGGETHGSVQGIFINFFTSKIWPVIILGAIIITIVAIMGIIYSHRKMSALIEEEKELYGLKDVPLPIGTEYVEKKNESWESVLKHINSANSSDWRLAIIEADIMLDALLRAAGYHGDTTGEMLKAVEKSDFITIEEAWQAHKIRNRIAHSGSRFPLNEREAKMAITLYEQVFKEFKII